MVKTCVRLALMLCFVASAGNVFAEGFGLYEWSSRGVALGGAAMARKPDASSVAYNPALLTRLSGARAMVGVSAVMPRGKVQWTDEHGKQGTTTLKRLNWFIPHAYFTRQLNDDWVFGIGEYTRFGLGFEYPHDWIGRHNIYEVELTTFSINPNIAWRATENLSVAAGVEVMYVSLDLRKRVAVGDVTVAPGLTLKGGDFDVNIRNADAWGVGGNFALHYKFNEQWAVGLQYKSKVRVHAFGDVSYNNIDMNPMLYSNPRVMGNQKNGTAHSVVVFPDSVSAGLAYMPIPELSLEAGFVWTRWSAFNSLNIHFPQPMGKQDTPKHWRDAWRFNAGIEYEMCDRLTLRGGYVYDQTPMTEAYEDYLVPTNDRHIWSAGIGLNFDAWTVDLSAAFIDAIGRRYQADARTHTVRSRAKASDTYIYSLSVGYKF
ncbi:MAG: outer membrane protein transport protein [Desulfovibrio sp.]|jgi:long-chain fatty acid transport protein|nr:outer membrane protein transport protein [Desulfovibrio sp.]